MDEFDRSAINDLLLRHLHLLHEYLRWSEAEYEKEPDGHNRLERYKAQIVAQYLKDLLSKVNSGAE